MSESSGRTESEGLGRSVSMVVDTFVDESVRRNIAVSIHITLVDRDSLGELEYKLKSNKRLDRVVWTAEYDGIMNKTLHDYDLEMFEKARNTRAAKTRRIKQEYLSAHFRWLRLQNLEEILLRKNHAAQYIIMLSKKLAQRTIATHDTIALLYDVKANSISQ
ncbi:unnamed protein product [Rhizophagus irregularis]|uniref:Uncharacterized protein n=1 Tax=Rhizophagus irregularis TaxID=588596 RepID=A0A915ZPE0_9GLOM|nr:unnamed protein product [Rhizophagus irregularis]CAB5204682.1 unnamed protein product [Rhizophagus irregularis]CAB5385476.1 unnamed protein product [Rhizophagus irregularis]